MELREAVPDWYKPRGPTAQVGCIPKDARNGLASSGAVGGVCEFDCQHAIFVEDHTGEARNVVRNLQEQFVQRRTGRGGLRIEDRILNGPVGSER
jgi:hypothetical protein